MLFVFAGVVRCLLLLLWFAFVIVCVLFLFAIVNCSLLLVVCLIAAVDAVVCDCV